MTKITKICSGELYDTYLVVEWGQGTYLSRVWVLVPIGANVRSIFRSAFAALGIRMRKVVLVV